MNVLLKMNVRQKNHLIKAANIIIAADSFDFYNMLELLKFKYVYHKTVEDMILSIIGKVTNKTPQIEAARDIFAILSGQAGRNISLKIPESDWRHVSNCFETIARVGMFQMDMFLELYHPMVAWDDRMALEKLMKDLTCNQKGLGIRNDEVPETCKVCWDAYQHVRREFSWYGVGKDWRTDERTYGAYLIKDSMTGVNFDNPMKTSSISGEFKTERILDV